MKKNASKIVMFILIVLISLSFIAIKDISDENMRIYFLDVGQGDSIYVRYKHIDLLVDGGPDNQALYELGKYRPFYDQKIEYIILTHPHADHIKGLLEIVNRNDVGTIFMTDAVSESAVYNSFIQIINDRDINIHIIKERNCQNIDLLYDICFIWPTSSYADQKISNLNDTSIMAKLMFGNFSLMLTGDIENTKQSVIALQEKNFLKSDILKAAHHGADNGIENSFMSYVNPELVIISVGENNKYKHPGKKHIEYLEQNDISYLRTDKHGTIEIITNGINFWTN